MTDVEHEVFRVTNRTRTIRKSTVVIDILALTTWVLVGLVLHPGRGLDGAAWFVAYITVYYLALGPVLDEMDAVGWLP